MGPAAQARGDETDFGQSSVECAASIKVVSPQMRREAVLVMQWK
jgi:hypothetical protein